MNKRGLLIVLSGPSGVGKGTVLRSYLEKNPNTRLSVSATTRQPRMGEVNGVHYYFLTEKEFEKKVEQNEMLEYATYSGNRYGTPGGPVKEMLEDGHEDVYKRQRMTLPAQVRVVTKEPGRVVMVITIKEGRNRQIRKMCEAVGLEVARLKRISVGPLKLGMLQPGKWRYLQLNEIIMLRNAASGAKTVHVRRQER